MPDPRPRRRLRRPPPGAVFAALALAAAVSPAPASAADLRGRSPSSLLPPGALEIRAWESRYTQTRFFDADGTRTGAGGRATWHTATLSFARGWREGLEPGLELRFRAVDDATVPGDGTRAGVTAVVPGVQWAPWPDRPARSLRTSVVVPTGDDHDGSDGRAFLDFGDWQLVQQLLADVTLSERWQAYVEYGAVVRLDRSQDDVQVSTPLQVALNWHGGRSWTLYGLAGASPDWIGDARGNYWSQVGGGAKWRPVPGFELEALATAFPLGRNAGAGTTLNAGVRWAR